MTDHTVKAFDDDLNRLRGLVSEMGSRATMAIEQAMTALDTRNRDSAAQIAADDRLIDELEAEIEKLVVTTIALRAPMADDLRSMIAALKIAAAFGFGVETIERLVLNAVRASLLPEDKRIEMEAQFRQEFAELQKALQ